MQTTRPTTTKTKLQWSESNLKTQKPRFCFHFAALFFGHHLLGCSAVLRSWSMFLNHHHQNDKAKKPEKNETKRKGEGRDGRISVSAEKRNGCLPNSWFRLFSFDPLRLFLFQHFYVFYFLGGGVRARERVHQYNRAMRNLKKLEKLNRFATSGNLPKCFDWDWLRWSTSGSCSVNAGVFRAYFMSSSTFSATWARTQVTQDNPAGNPCSTCKSDPEYMVVT